MNDSRSERPGAAPPTTGALPDAAVIGDLYRRCRSRVQAYAFRALADHHEAEDVTQEVFAKAFEALPRYQTTEAGFERWLFRIARNHLVDLHRSGGRIEVREPAAVALTAADPLPDVASRLDDPMSYHVEHLPQAQRRVVFLRYYAGMSPGDIADLLGVTPGSVYQNHHLAMAALRASLVAPQPLR